MCCLCVAQFLRVRVLARRVALRSIAFLHHAYMATSGKWKTAEEITELVAPPKEVSESVVSFLRLQGAPKVENFRDMVKVTASVRWVEELLETSLFFFQHKTSKWKGGGIMIKKYSRWVLILLKERRK
jgi:hypothetical protein